MSESGSDSGLRNIGRFFLALIPWALGIGALTWISVYVGVHEYREQIAQEARKASYVGAASRPVVKVKIEAVQEGCVIVTHADVDGPQLTLYARNQCHTRISYLAWNWQEISPDNTILHQGYQNNAYCAVPTDPGEQAECAIDMGEPDDRVEKVKIWVSQ